MICLYRKIPENYVRLILQDGFWFVYKPFGSMVKFQFLAQFPGDPFPTQLCLFFGLVCFYGISTVVGYLMPNPFLYIYMKYKIS